MPRGRPKSSKTGGVKGRIQLKVIDRKPIRPLERQRMRPWLMDLLDKAKCHQLSWYNKREKTFRVAWKHAAGQTFDPEADATLFELWANHTGKYYKGDKPDPKKWKANFRCALHSLGDVDEDKHLGVKKGNNAFRVYRFLDEKRVKKPVSKKERDNKITDEFDDEAFIQFRKVGTRSRPKKMDDLDSEGSETGYSPAHDSSHSDWEMSDMRGQEETEAERSPLPHFEQLCESPFQNVTIKQEPREEPADPFYQIRAGTIIIDDDDGIYRPQLVEEGPVYENYNTHGVEWIFTECELDGDLDLQEEVVTTAGPVTGPSVIVIEEQGSYDYHNYTTYTSLENL